jgi:light-regulated signal transduction histidine kinase (bacteriophytochrome)
LQYANEELNRRNAELGDAKDALELSNVELQQFAYIASHDLQTPLRSIAAFAQFLQKDYEGQLDEQADDYIGRLVGGVKRMQNLITDLLAYSRVESRAAPFVAVDLNQLCDDVVVLLRTCVEDAGGRVTRDELPTVVGDRSQLSQLLQNLIDNALKYRHKDPPRVHVSAEQNGSGWTISVRDNGIGIDARHHEQIFEVFRRLHTEREYPGTGIGLAICRRIVQRHGGHLWLESKPGQGSTFYFTVPEFSHEEQGS